MRQQKNSCASRIAVCVTLSQNGYSANMPREAVMYQLFSHYRQDDKALHEQQA